MLRLNARWGHAHPVLLIARRDQPGSFATKPAECRMCHAEIYITDDLSLGALKVLNVAAEGKRP